MDRHAQQPAPFDRGAQPFRPDQEEAYDGLLLALLARKRLLVLAGGTAPERSEVFAQLIEQVAADGSLVLPVVAQHGMQVEDLVAAAAAFDVPESDGDEFDTLIEELEGRLDLAGSGLLAVDDAHLLDPATLVDLADLSRSETGSGRFMQVLLCGAPELERLLARPALDQFIRDAGVVYRLAGGDTEPGADAPAISGAIDLGMRPLPKPALETAAAKGASSSLFAPLRSQARPRALAGAWVTAFILIAAGGAATTLAIKVLKPDVRIEEYAARLGDKTEHLLTDTKATVREWSHDTFGWPPLDADALALERGRTPGLETRPAPPQPNEPAPAGSHKDAVAALPPSDRPPSDRPPSDRAGAADPATHPTTIDRPSTATTEPGPVPPTIIVPPPIVLPPVPAAPTPPAPVSVAAVPTPPPAQPAAPAPDQPAPPQAAAPPPATAPADTAAAATAKPPSQDQATAQRVRALVEQTRRQIATKRLTTPPGDNAHETVQQIRELAPDTPEIPVLLSGIVDTYRRWAAQAESDGQMADARRYYERALMVNPNDPALRAQAKDNEERTRRAESQPPKPPPADAAGGFTDQDATLAILHHPPTLAAALNAGQNPNHRLDTGKTPLMLAAEAGLRDATRMLLDHGASPNLRTRDGATAIMYAAWNGRDDVVALLADAGADVNASNDDGKTALMAAAARGHAGVVRALLARGATVDRAANHGWTALMYAAHAGNEPVVRMLMEAGANPSRTDQMGNSAVSLSRQQGHVISALLGR